MSAKPKLPACCLSSARRCWTCRPRRAGAAPAGQRRHARPAPASVARRRRSAAAACTPAPGLQRRAHACRREALAPPCCQVRATRPADRSAQAARAVEPAAVVALRQLAPVEREGLAVVARVQPGPHLARTLGPALLQARQRGRALGRQRARCSRARLPCPASAGSSQVEQAPAHRAASASTPRHTASATSSAARGQRVELLSPVVARGLEPASRSRWRPVPRRTGSRCRRRVRAACAGTRRRWCAPPRRPCSRRPSPAARRPAVRAAPGG